METLINPSGGGGGEAVDVEFAPAGTIAATNVQAAIEEVATEAGAAVEAADVTFTPTGTIAATDVQAAIAEAASEAASFSGLFGDGSDGDVVMDGTTTLVGLGQYTINPGNLIPASNVYTMTRDIFCEDLTINTGVTLRTAGFKVFVNGILLNNGTIESNGTSASGATQGVGGAGATNSTVVAQDGRPGGTGVGTAAPTVFVMRKGTGVATGKGGIGGNGAPNAGGAGSAFAANQQTRYVPHLVVQPAYGLTASAQGGASGGGDGTNSGGGGGGGAGMIILVAKAITNNGTIRANGGNGGTTSAGNTGGGGGGAGGVITIVTLPAFIPVGGTLQVNGGSGGIGNGTPSTGSKDGVAGNVGTILVMSP
jgi:hypothetical protein